MRDMFTEVPFPLDFKIYLFNVTNKAEVNTGGKPKLQEVGPFYFELSLGFLGNALTYFFLTENFIFQRMESKI